MVEIPEGLAARPLTEEDFSFVYDAEHTYYFFEGESGDLAAFNHVDVDRFAEDATNYYRYTSGDEDLEAVDGSQVRHVYAVGVDDPNHDILFIFCARTDEHARPISILWP